jgi:hypothetical protein
MVYDMVSTPPAAEPVTLPVLLTVALLLLALQVPPLIVSVSDIDVLPQSVVPPLMAPADRKVPTVTTIVVVALPQGVITL